MFTAKMTIAGFDPELAKAIADVLPMTILIVFTFASMFLGYATPTEAAAVGCTGPGSDRPKAGPPWPYPPMAGRSPSARTRATSTCGTCPRRECCGR